MFPLAAGLPCVCGAAAYTVAMRALRLAARALALLLAVLVALFYALFLRPAALKTRVREVLGRYLAAKIALGSASLDPFGGLTLKGIDVRTQPGDALLFRAERLRVRPRWSALARMKFQIGELDLREPDLRFERDAEGRSNWRGVVTRPPEAGGGPPPVFTLTRGRVTVGDSRIQGLTCELTPFPSEKLVALRGTVDDPFWGSYTVSGNADLGLETLRVSLEGKGLKVTEDWISAFPLIGRNIWARYRPAGLFDLSGTLALCWGAAGGGDYSLVFTARNASCRYLAFPVTKATGRIFADPRSVIVNRLDGAMLGGRVQGYSIVNLGTPCAYFNRYSFEGVDIGEFARKLQPGAEGLRGTGSGCVTFQRDQPRGELQGRGELVVSNARLWRLPVLILVLSKVQLAWPTGEEPVQECRIVYTFDRRGFRIAELGITSDVLDLYGAGTMGFDGAIDLTLYARPVSRSPLSLADLLLQPALDSLSGNLAQFRVTGTAADPALTVIPLTPVSNTIVDFFDALTLKRFSR